MNIRMGIIALYLLAALAGWRQEGLATETVPIAISVGFEVGVLTHTWSDETRENVLVESKQEIAKYLKSICPHWDFRYDEKNYNRSISLRIVDPNQDDNLIEASLQLNLHSGARLDEQWTAPWLIAVEIQYRRYPKAKTMARRLKDLFKKHFMEDPNVNIREWLHKKVPVARNAYWLDLSDKDPWFRMVLSMPYENFSELRSSVFEIAGKPKTGLPEKFEAHGIEISIPYPPATTAKKEYDGIVAQAVQRIVAGQSKPFAHEVHSLALGPVYLVKEVTPTDQDVDLFEEDSK